MAKVFGIGLPRCGGQTLQRALATILGGNVYHSPGSNWRVMDEDFTAAVEVFAPIPWLLCKYPDAKFILNVRNRHDWYKSCEKVYPASAKQNWNHPLWKYPLHQFKDYWSEYLDRRMSQTPMQRGRAMVWDVTTEPDWKPLCSFLGVAEPDCPFPNVDPVGRPAEHQPDETQFPWSGTDWRMGY